MKRYALQELRELLLTTERCGYDPEGMTARTALDAAFTDLVALSNQAKGPKTKRHKSETVVQTDPLFIAAVKREFGPLKVDLAANEHNHQAPNWLGPGSDYPDALDKVLAWWHLGPGVWLNPPFDPIAPWVAKARTEAYRAYAERDEFGAGFQLLLLCPLSPGTNWWRDHVEPWATPIAVGRQKFVGRKDPFRRDLALCVYQSRPAKIPGKIYRWDWNNTALSAEIKDALA
jgi:hypothetical protein